MAEGRPQGGMKSAEGRAVYWRMNHEHAIHALSDLLTEHRELVEAIEALAVELDKATGFRGVATSLREIVNSPAQPPYDEDPDLPEALAEARRAGLPNIGDTCCGECPSGTCYVDGVTGA